MEWKHYDMKIVELHSVQLVCWPGKTFDPHVLTISDLEACVEALQGSKLTCYWHKMSTWEITEHRENIAKKMATGVIVKKPRKKHSDAGVKRKT
ncbi:hypothetical protein BU17DRAFT_59272 [Hysterangium stoloniferum]|nr:hypothetical protein BU17DRAFT_59272 [Hysterangium stoloniferum]